MDAPIVVPIVQYPRGRDTLYESFLWKKARMSWMTTFWPAQKLILEKCSRCGNERDIEHEWTVVGNKRKCSRCGKEILPTHYVAVAISSCKETDTDRFEKSKGYFMNEYKNDPSFSDLNSGKWEYKEKFLTYPTSDFNVMRVVLEWIAEEVGVSAEKLVEENGKRLFVIKTPVPLGPSLWAVAHYFNE